MQTPDTVNNSSRSALQLIPVNPYNFIPVEIQLTQSTLGRVIAPHIFMEILTKEPWWKLAEQAAVEENPNKLLLLMVEINRLLAADRSGKARDAPPSDSTQP